ncbi:MAG: Endo,4-beta-xylanase precursor, partial [Bacteroidota bacterium]
HRRSDYAPWAAFETLTPNEKALVTYSAYTYDKDRISKVGANSDDYLKFIFKELKPFIDSSYSTLPDKAHTFMAGSSMGGIISLYALINYPDQLGGVACLSTHWPIVNIGNENPFPLSFINYINTHLPDLTSHRIYFDHGDQGRDAEYAIWQKQVDALFLKAGANEKQYLSRYFPGEGHNEKAWSKRLSIPLTFLLSE